MDATHTTNKRHMERMDTPKEIKRIAVFIQCNPSQGGTFQYAYNILKILASLPQGTGRIRVWHYGQWEMLLNNLGLEHENIMKSIQDVKSSISKVLQRPKNIAPSRWYREVLPSIAPVQLIQQWQPHILIIPEQLSLGLNVDCHQLSVIHDLMHIYEPSFPEVGIPVEQARRNALYTEIVTRTSTILVDSPLGKEHVLAQYPATPEQIHVFPFIPSEKLLQAKPVKPQNIKEPFFLFPAQFWLHKNHVRLTEAMACVAKKYPDIHAVFVGTTQYEGYPATQEAIIRLGVQNHVSILGYVSDEELAWLYRHARFLFFPSFFGPTNIPPLEAMALGCPAGVSDCYAMPWQCGDAVIYFDPKCINSMATALEQLWSDDALRTRLREQGFERAKLWTFEHQRQNFHALLTDVIHRMA